MNAPILLVGELNPYGSNPKYALYPYPLHASGNRLRKILGLTKVEYLRQHDRVNLCAGTWSAPAARKEAARLLGLGYKGMVLCGARVAAAFDLPYRPGVTTFPANYPTALLVIPHPSGANRAWNEPEASEYVRAAYQALLKQVLP